MLASIVVAGSLVFAIAARTAGAASPSPSAGTPASTSASPAASIVASPSPAPGSGAAIYATNCAACHGPRGEGLLGPSLAAAADAGLVAGQARVGFALKPVVPGAVTMPSFVNSLGEAKIQLVAEYVATTLSDPSARGASAEQGGDIYRLYCSACHGATARGGALAKGKNAPSLAQYAPAEALAAVILGRSNMPVFAGNTLNVRQQTAVALYVRDLISLARPGGNGLGFVGPVAEGAMTGVGLLVLVLIAVWLAWGKGGKSRA